MKQYKNAILVEYFLPKVSAILKNIEISNPRMLLGIDFNMEETNEL